jgi:hypothetical protein
VIRLDAKGLRQVSNQIGQVAGELTQQSFDAGRDMDRLQLELATLRGAADICRNLARRQEAQAAQLDETAPLCLGCAHRTDAPGGLGCSLGIDTKEAVAKRKCGRYSPE